MAPPRQRKVPFSNKKKKEQLQEKRERKKNEIRDEFGVTDHRSLKKNKGSESKDREEFRKINYQPEPHGLNSKSYDPKRYRLQFRSDTNEEVEKGKVLSKEPVYLLPEEACEIDLDEVYKPGTVLDMPKRPKWDYSLSRDQLNRNEEMYFKGYIDKIFERYQSSEMSYFELNLETWRQLWRVLEMSDVILLITDIRHPALHFPPALYDYITHDLKKKIILVLNKIDLAPPSLVIAWKTYFEKRFSEVSVVLFTAMPKDDEERFLINADPTQVLFKKRRKRNFIAVGPKQLLQACEKIVHGNIDLSSWKQKIEYDASITCVDDEDNDIAIEDKVDEDYDTGYRDYDSYLDHILTIGCCGYPNVGKSSLINGLMGKKVVSVSRTPGHTKHFQTIFLTKNVRLCDSPGLVFPSFVQKPLQILSGIFPISQLREPYTTIKFLAERLPLPSLLKLDQGISCGEWSAYSICDAWAECRGFVTAKAARNDVYRAANHLLRMSVEGRLCLCMKPPGYCSSIDNWKNHPETKEVLRLQEMCKGVTTFSDLELKDENFSDEEDDHDEGFALHEQINNPFDLLCDE